MSESTFQYDHRVTYAECTLGNHIYYSRYLDLIEAARGEFFRHIGAPLIELQTQEIIFPVIECRLRYKAPARYDDRLTIELWLTAAERVRMNFRYRIVNQNGTLILEADTFHVCTGLNEKPRRVPEELSSKLAPFMSPLPKISGARQDV